MAIRHPGSTPTSLLDLPSEILDNICLFDACPLKALRLTHSLLRHAATPALFRSVMIVPHETSFRNLLALSRSLELARHVHELVYDMRMLSSVPDIKMAFEANEFALFPDETDMSRKKAFRLLDDHEAKAFKSVETCEIEINCLLKILQGLPSLKHIKLTSGAGNGVRPMEPLPSLYQRLKRSVFINSDYYFEASQQSGHHARSVLLCLCALDMSIPSISLLGIDTQQLITFSELRSRARYLTILQRVLRRLPRGSLPLPLFMFLYTNKDDDRGAALDDLIPAMASALNRVQNLTLVLATSHSKRQLFLPSGYSPPRYAENAYLHWILQCLYSDEGSGSNLKKLSLSQFAVSPPAMQHLLGQCQMTLVELELGDARLYHDDGDADQDGPCWVAVLETIPRRMENLKRVKLVGRFFNGQNQDWVISDNEVLNSSRDNLKSRVESWLVDGGSCPLETERIGSNVGDLLNLSSDMSFIFRPNNEHMSDVHDGPGFASTEGSMSAY